MKDWGRVEVGTIATISTSHIPRDELKTLEKHYDTQSHQITDDDHWINRFNWASFPYGYIIGAYLLKSMLENNETEGVPQFLIEAAEMARDLNLAWIVYDEDGEVVDGLTDWWKDE